MRRFAATVLVFLASCAHSRPAPDIPPALLKDLIASAEDRRRADIGLFVHAVLHRDPDVQRAGAIALGRMQNESDVPFLILFRAFALGEEVEVEALFAMGQMGLRPAGLSPESVDQLLMQVTASLKDPRDAVRAAAAEAAGKLALEKAPGMVAPLLKDPSPVVRRQAASACFRWRQVIRMRAPEATLPDLPVAVVDALSDAVGDPDDEFRWRAAHALLRSGSKPSPATLRRFIEDKDPLARLFALNIVERHKLQEVAEVAARAQTDPEAIVRQASLRAIDALDRQDLLLKKLAADPSHHVREAVADVLLADGPELESLSKDDSVAVRSAAMLARVRIHEDKALPSLEMAMADGDPRIRIAVVKAAGHVAFGGLALLLKGRSDESEDVRAAALVALAEREGAEAWAAIKEGLSAKGLAERGTAAESTGKRKEPEAVAAAIACFRNSGAREWVEVRESLVDQLAGRPQEETTPFLIEVARGDPSPSVRQRAVAALRKRGVNDIPEPPAEKPTSTPYLMRRFSTSPTVVMETTKGTLEIRCAFAEAPVHVANFVGLVERGFYDGLAWHRVVPNFVIQGGDPLGNGWGDAGWSLRAEVNRLPYVRGTLGMPRSAGFDTGGCQIFITHVPTPHLDGLYTVFGQVVKGLEVMDKIEVGDRIIRATLLR